MDLKEMIAAHIFNDEMKEKVIKALNDNINIPIIGEDTEEKILTAIYESIEDVVKSDTKIMPKSVYKIDEFDAGLVTHQSERDIPDKALSVAENIMVDIKGQIRLMGKSHIHPDFGNVSIDQGIVNPGYGLFALHHDYNFIPHLIIHSISGTTAIAETTPPLYKKTIDVGSADHGFKDGSVVRIYGTASGTFDGQYGIEKKDDNEFYFTHSSNSEVSTGTDGYVSSAAGSFRSLFLDDNGTMKIFPEYGDSISGWTQNNYATILALGANYGRFSSSSFDYPQNWESARLNYLYYDGALRISNSNHNDPTSLANHDKYDWPTWLGYIDEKLFTAGGTDLVGTVTWRPQWYQTISHAMNPYEWNTIRNFYNRHDGSWGVDVNDSLDTSGSAGRAQQCFVYAYPGDGIAASDESGVRALEFDTNLRSDCSAVGVNSMTILPGQFGVRMWTDGTTYAGGSWPQKIYKFGYSYYYDDDALNSASLQDSEIIPMGGWGVGQSNPSNCYLNAHAIDGALNLTSSGSDSETIPTAFNVENVEIEMQVFLNSGGTSNETNDESGQGNAPLYSFFPPRVKGIRVWLIGEVDAAGASGKITYIDDPRLALEIDFKLGVRLSAEGEFAEWEAISGSADAIEPDGNPAEEDFLLTHKTLISTEEPLETYSSVNSYRHDRAYGSVKGKTDTILNDRRYVGNVIADEGVAGAPHNVFDDSKRKLITKSDHVFVSQTNKPDIFLKEDILQIGEENDGEEVVKVDSLGSQLLVWKENTLYVYDTTEGQEILIQTYKHMGLLHPHAVTKVEKGIAWINKNGLYMYDGEQMGNAITGKINPKEWSDFVGKDANLGYIPMNKQIVVFQSGVGNSSSGNVYIFDVSTDSVTYGSNVLSPLAKSNTVSNYDGSLMYAGPKLHEHHKIDTYEIAGRAPGSIGRWEIRGIGDNLLWNSTKLTIKSTDITNTFSLHSTGDGNNAIDQIIQEINAKCGVGTFVFEPDYERGILVIVWPITSATVSTYNADNLNGDLTITNSPRLMRPIDQTTLTTDYLVMLDGQNYEDFNTSSPYYPVTVNGEVVSTQNLRAVGMNSTGQTRHNRTLNPPVDPRILKKCRAFRISDSAGYSIINNNDEALYLINNDIQDSSGASQDYDTLVASGMEFINTLGPNLSDFNFTTPTFSPAKADIILPVFWVESLGATNTYKHVYFTDASVIKYFYPGLYFSWSGAFQNPDITFQVMNTEIISFGDRKVGRILIEVPEGQGIGDNSGYNYTTGSFNSITFDFNQTGNDYTNSNLGVVNHEIPNSDGGKQYYIVPKFTHTSDNAASLVTYTISVSGNDGNSYQFQHTRASDEYLYKTMLNLKASMEEANHTQSIWRQVTNFEDSTYFIMPRLTLSVNFNSTDNTITDTSKTLRNYGQLLQPGCAFNIINANTSAHNRTFIVKTFESTDDGDIIEINTSADTMTTASPSAIGTNITTGDTSDEITITFHSLYMTETVSKPYELFVNSGVYSGAQIYNFENTLDTDLVNSPKFSTKDIDLGAPGVKKNLIKAYITISNSDDLKIQYSLNGSNEMHDLRPAFGNHETITHKSDTFETFELVPEYGAPEETRKAFYSIQLHFSAMRPQSNFKLNDISVVYRSLGVR